MAESEAADPRSCDDREARSYSAVRHDDPAWREVPSLGHRPRNANARAFIFRRFTHSSVAAKSALAAVQLKCDRARARPGGDVVVAHAAGESARKAALWSCDEDDELPADGAVDHMETLGAEAGAKIDHVIVASVSRQVAFVHDTRLVGERRASLREALLEVLIERLLHRTWIGRLRDGELRCGSQPAGLALGRVGVGRRGLGRGPGFRLRAALARCPWWPVRRR